MAEQEGTISTHRYMKVPATSAEDGRMFREATTSASAAARVLEDARAAAVEVLTLLG